VLNSPSNPSGIVYTRDELAGLATTAIRHGMTIVSDEIYEKMVYDGCTATSVASISPEIAERTITVNGFSKAYAMTGWRLGYAAGPAPFATAMGALQSHCASAPNTFAQHAAIVALRDGAESIREMVAALDRRRQRLYELLCAIPGVTCVRPKGAFYALPDISSFGLGSVDFASRLLEEKHVAVVPGVAFGVDDRIRLSYACGIEEIERGTELLAEFCASLRQSAPSP
jgi:aspartate aminotransferase